MKLFRSLWWVVLFGGLSVWAGTVQNPHGPLKWDCQACHTPKGWKQLRFPLKFNHTETGYPLVGKHKSANCLGCHTDLKFRYVGVTCADCHTDIHQAALGLDCQRCHTPNGWTSQQNILELHENRGFTLTGVHATVDCQACHQGDRETRFVGTPTECQGCHATAFQQTTNPDHAKAGFKLNCGACHTMTSATWQQSSFQHVPIATMKGAHAQLTCNDCHHQQFKGTSQNCDDCHHTDYLATTEPAHRQFQFPTRCEVCHNQVSWNDAEFDHLQQSGFALEGAHAHIGCIQCHVNNQTSGLPRDCFGCHADNYRNATDPNHVSGNFNHDCTQCHSNQSWTPATFNHNNTNFPLTGAHQQLECQSCHANGYSGTPTDCYSCHQSNYESTTDPDHQAAGFSTNCETCHSTDAWQPATFDHDQTDFPLTGAHKTVQCQDCHGNGYSGTPTDCHSCHKTDYDNTTDPNHQAAGFPTNCENCHNTNRWNETTWDHDSQYFPIYSGKHKDKWNTCSDCHVNSTNFAIFECINCHEHNKTKMDDKHKDVSGYVYQSAACYNCHPNGRE